MFDSIDLIAQWWGGVALTTFSRRDDCTDRLNGLDLEEAAEALGVPFRLEGGQRISFRAADLPRLRSWLDARHASRGAPTASAGKGAKKSRLTPYEQAKEDQRKKNDARRESDATHRAPSPLPPTTTGKGAAMRAVSVNDFVAANPRDMGLAGALAIAAAATGERAAVGRPGSTRVSVDEAVRVHAREPGFAGALAMHAMIHGGAMERSALSGVATKRKTAKEEVEETLAQRLDARLQQKRRFRANATLSSGEVLRERVRLFSDYPELRERLIAEANTHQHGHGTCTVRNTA